MSPLSAGPRGGAAGASGAVRPGGRGARGLGPGAQGPGPGPGARAQGPQARGLPRAQGQERSLDVVSILGPVVFEKRNDEH